jgi:hypothetical protein
MSTTVEGLSLVTVIALIRKEIAESGVEGVAGKDGKQGAKGDRGPKGDTGPQGKVGPKGGDGKQGRAGKDGKDGADGQDGADGVGIANIEQDVDNAIIVTMTDGTTYTVEMPLGQNTEVHYKVNGGGSGGGSGTVDLSNYVKRPEGAKRDGSWLVYRETADGTVKEWTPVTTDLVATNPGILFRDAKGRFKSVDVPDLKSQLEVNRWLLEQIELNTESIDNINSLGYDDTEIKSDLAKETQERKDGDAQLQAEIDAIDFPDPDLDGYATEIYVDEAISSIDFPDPDLDAYATTEYVDGKVEDVEALIPSLDGYATETYVKTEIGKIDHPEYDDSGIKQDLSDETAARIAGDNTLQAEITELALALDTLLVQKTHGQWKYIGFMGDNIPRNAGEFALGSDDLSSESNVIQMNLTDLNGLTIGLGDVDVGDYVEIVDVGNPQNYVLFVVSAEPNGVGISDIAVTLKEKGNNFLINATCEMRFFELNDQSIDLTELDDRYALKGEIPNTDDFASIDYSDAEDAKIMARVQEIEDSLNVIEPDPEDFGELPWGPSGRGFYRYATNNSSMACGFIIRTKTASPYAFSKEQLDQLREEEGPISLSDIVCIEFPERTASGEDLSLVVNDYDWSANPPEYGSWMTIKYDHKYDPDQTTHLCIGDYIGYNERNKTYMFECLGIGGEDTLVCSYYDQLHDYDNKEIPLFYMNSTYSPALYVEKEEFNANNAKIYEDMERGDEASKEYTDLKIAEQILNETLPDKQLTYHMPEYYWTGGYSAAGKMTAKPSYKDDPQDWTEVYFYYTEKDGSDSKEKLLSVKEGDYIELVHDSKNWVLLKAKREARFISTYVYVNIEHVASAGEFVYDNNALNENTQVQVKLWEGEEGPAAPLSEREKDYGYYHYEMSSTLTVNDLADNPGYFIGVDADDNTTGSLYSPRPVALLFAPLDKEGKRPPHTTGTNDYQNKRFKFWNFFSVEIEKGERVPAWAINAKTFDKPLTYCSRRDVNNKQMVMIKLPDDYEYNYIKMGDDLRWKWPI